MLLPTAQGAGCGPAKKRQIPGAGDAFRSHIQRTTGLGKKHFDSYLGITRYLRPIDSIPHLWLNHSSRFESAGASRQSSSEVKGYDQWQDVAVRSTDTGTKAILGNPAGTVMTTVSTRIGDVMAMRKRQQHFVQTNSGVIAPEQRTKRAPVARLGHEEWKQKLEADLRSHLETLQKCVCELLLKNQQLR